MLARTAASQSRRRRVSASRRQPSRRAPDRAALTSWLNRLLLASGLSIVLVIGYQAWSALMSMPVGRIAVSGTLDVSRQETLQTAVEQVLDAGFVAADLSRVRASLEGLPWVYSASVRRRWPDTLDIRVVEQLPIARWGDRGFLNHEGAVFAGSGRGAWSELPMIHGPAGSEQRLMQHYQRLRDLLAPAGLVVARLEQDGLGQLHAELQSGLRLNMGNEQFLLRVRRFLDLYRDDLVQRAAQVARVDMRYAKGAAVTFREPPQLAAVDSHKGDQGD
ncbi:MAG: cell division protein FtsQ/DivIB [Chromatocurvus sp.]